MTDKKISESPQTDLLKLQTGFFTELANKGRSQNTLKNYKTDLDCFNNYLKIKQNSLILDNLTTTYILDYGHYLDNKYTSNNSRRRRVQALRIFFDYLVSEKVFSSNPVREIPTSPKFLDIPRPTHFIEIKTNWVYLLEEASSKQQMTRLLAMRNQVIMLLIYGAGLKVSDLAKLKKESIFLDDNDGARVLIHSAKRDPYTIPLPSIFTKIFTHYTSILEASKLDSKIEFPEILFNANPYRILSGGLSPRGVEIIFEDFRKKLVIQSTPKSLRQACIFRWLQEGKKDGQIKEWLGVAPAYSLKNYKDHMDKNTYSDHFLEETYKNFREI